MSQFGCVAERDPPDPTKPFDKSAAIEQLFKDIAEAKRLAFLGREDDAGNCNPDLTALPKILELEAKCLGVLSPDGKRANDGSGNVEVPLEKIERLVAAAKLKQKEKKNGDE